MMGSVQATTEDLGNAPVAAFKGESASENSPCVGVLHVAAARRDAGLMRFHIMAGALLNSRDQHGLTPLHVACARLHDEGVLVLRVHGCDMTARTHRRRLTPLHVCACWNSTACGRLLLDGSTVCCVDAGDVFDWTALHYAAHRGHTQMVELLLEYGAAINAADRRGRRPLHLATLTGRHAVVRQLLQCGAEIDAASDDMWTAMHVASVMGDVCSLDALHDAYRRVNVDATSTAAAAADRHGNSPLHLACLNAQPLAVGWLLHVLTSGGRQDCVRRRNARHMTPLHLAVGSRAGDNGDTCVRLILAHFSTTRSPAAPRLPNVDDKCVDLAAPTAVHVAAANGHTSRLRWLLESGETVCNTSSSQVPAPLLLAVAHHHASVVSLLLQHGAHVNCFGPLGESCVHVAAGGGDVSLLRLLVSRGASWQTRDSEARTPLHWASHHGHVDIVCVLKRYASGRCSVEFHNHQAPEADNPTAFDPCDPNDQYDPSDPYDPSDQYHRSYPCGACDLSDPHESRDLSDPSDPNDPSDRGVDVDSLNSYIHTQDNQGRTAIQYAALRGHYQVVCELLCGPHVDNTDNSGRTSLHYAAAGDHTGRIVALLLSAGCVASTCDTSGATPLHVAAARGTTAALDQLLRCRPPANSCWLCWQPSKTAAVSRVSWSPLHLAAFHGHASCVQLLLNFGNNGPEPGPPDSLGVLQQHSRQCSCYEGSRRATPLHLAVARGHIDCTRALLACQADWQTCDSDGRTPLHVAAATAHWRCAGLLIINAVNTQLRRHGLASLHLDVAVVEAAVVADCGADETNSALLQCAAKYGSVVDFINCVDDKLRTALMLAVTSCANTSGVTSSCPAATEVSDPVRLVRFLLLLKAATHRADHLGHTALHRTIMTGAGVKCIDHIVDYCSTATILARDNDGKTVLHLAAAANCSGVLGALLRKLPAGPADQLLDDERCTPLHWACITGSLSCVEMLLMCSDKRRRLHGNTFSALHCAAHCGSERIISKLCGHFGWHCVQLSHIITTTTTTTTQLPLKPLHVAAARGHVACVQLLARATLATCHDGEWWCDRHYLDDRSPSQPTTTPLHMAAAGGHTRVCEVLMQSMGVAGVCARDSRGRTPLHMACATRHEHTALTLLASATDTDTTAQLSHFVNIVDNEMNTALQLAIDGGMTVVARRLVAAGGASNDNLQVQSVGTVGRSHTLLSVAASPAEASQDSHNDGASQDTH